MSDSSKTAICVALLVLCAGCGRAAPDAATTAEVQSAIDVSSQFVPFSSREASVGGIESEDADEGIGPGEGGEKYDRIVDNRSRLPIKDGSFYQRL